MPQKRPSNHLPSGAMQLMPSDMEKLARLLVRALYVATNGQPERWLTPAQVNNSTAQAIALAIDRGWMQTNDDLNVCLTDAGRVLVKVQANGGLP